MVTAVKVRIYPNVEQREKISQHFGGTRYIYNRMLKLKTYAYAKYGITLSKETLKKRIAVLKKRENTKWLKETNSQSLQEEVYSKMDKAYKTFFNGGGFPKFKSKHNPRQSFNIPQNISITKSGRHVTIPKIGEMRMKGYRKDIRGDIKTSALSCEAGRYFLSLTLKSEETPKTVNNGETIGIDVNVSNFLVDSRGIKISSLDLSKDYLKLENVQKQLSRKKKGSNNFRKNKIKLQRQHKKISNKRLDYLHKITNNYAHFKEVVIEGLNVKEMTKSNRGTVENPGKNVKLKSKRNRENLKQSWSKFYEILEYKLKRNGNDLIKVNPKNTSSTCNRCGNKDEKNRESQSVFICKKCGHTDNADLNAAKNIKLLSYSDFETLRRAYASINASGKTRIDLVEEEIFEEVTRPF